MLRHGFLTLALVLALGGMFRPKSGRTAFVCGPQVSDMEQLGKARKGLYRELRERTDLTQIIFMGDLVMDDAGLLAPTAATLDSLPCPWLCVPGDHDRDFYKRAASLRPGKALPARERDFSSFRKRIHSEDTTWVAAGIRWIILNNIRTLPRRQVREEQDASLYRGNDYIGGLNGRQKAWLENLLKTVPPKRPVVLCTHIPLNRCAGADSLGRILTLHPDIRQICCVPSDDDGILSVSDHGGICILDHKSGRWME